jgi:hypothetical protein
MALTKKKTLAIVTTGYFKIQVDTDTRRVGSVGVWGIEAVERWMPQDGLHRSDPAGEIVVARVQRAPSRFGLEEAADKAMGFLDPELTCAVRIVLNGVDGMTDFGVYFEP